MGEMPKIHNPYHALHSSGKPHHCCVPVLQHRFPKAIYSDCSEAKEAGWSESVGQNWIKVPATKLKMGEKAWLSQQEMDKVRTWSTSEELDSLHAIRKEEEQREAGERKEGGEEKNLSRESDDD